MSIGLMDDRVHAVLARLEQAEADLAGLDLELCSDDVVVETLRRREVSRHKSAVLDQALISQVGRRGVPFARGSVSVPVFLRQLLRISPREAGGRGKAAERLGPQHTTQGEPQEPIYPTISAAQADGSISAEHAAIIVRMIDKLPAAVAAELDRTIETALVDCAQTNDPTVLRHVADGIAYTYDQDGQYKDQADRERRRDLRLRDNPDGSGHIEGELTAECAERLRVVFDALAKPNPAADGTPDPRTPGQRRHDAFLDWLRLVEKARLLPDAGGIAATLLLTMDADVYAMSTEGHSTGTARTGHGFTVPADVAKRWAEPEARIMLVLLSKTKGIQAYSSVQRFFTEQQRLAMAARDRGCSYPGCDAPIAWTDAHHITDYQDTRRTSVDDGAPVCTKNHSTFETMGYQSIMINGRPHWKPPTWIDPHQTLIRNHLHDH